MIWGNKAAIFGTVTVLSLAGCSREPAVTNNGLQPSSATYAAPAPAGSLTPQPAPAAPGPRRFDENPAALAPEAPRQAGTLQQRPALESRRPAADPDKDGPRYIVKKRSKKKSAAIVGGSAAAGAGIGALAGGGKGAGIGAIVGGVGGLIYDRATHKKQERVER